VTLPSRSLLILNAGCGSPPSIDVAASFAELAGLQQPNAARDQSAAEAPAAGASASADGVTADSSSWLCIAAFDPTVLVLPTKSAAPRGCVLLLASDGSCPHVPFKGPLTISGWMRGSCSSMRTANTLLAPAAASCAAPGADEPNVHTGPRTEAGPGSFTSRPRSHDMHSLSWASGWAGPVGAPHHIPVRLGQELAVRHSRTI